MKYNDLRDFLTLLEQQGELKTYHAAGGSASGNHLKLLTALCVPVGLRCCSKTLKATQCRCCATCSVRRVAWRWAWGRKMFRRCVKLVNYLAFLKRTGAAKGFRDLFDKLPQFKQVLNMPTKRLRGAPCQKIVSGDDVDLNRIPIMTCWRKMPRR